jgi:C1A family cysteine protease
MAKKGRRNRQASKKGTARQAASTKRSVSHRYGWVPDVPDARDLMYAAPAAAMAVMPSKVDLTSLCPPVYDQGNLGSCTGNAIAAAYQFDEMKQASPSPFLPSRLFIYYNERAMEGTVNSDAGAQIRDGIKSIAQQGVCPETMWPYVISKFADKPTPACYTFALQHRAVQYRRIPRDLTQMRLCLAQGYPWVFGVSVYDSFESQAASQTGDIPLPNPSNESLLGGHAILAVGYDDARHVFLFRNSWGTGWGNHGYGTIPYSYLLDANLSDDFWTVRLVQGGSAGT